MGAENRESETIVLDNKELVVLASLRQNARKKLADISRETGVPLSTVFDKKKSLERKRVIKGYHSILDYAKLGYGIRTMFSFVVSVRKTKQMLNFLNSQPNTNSIFQLGCDSDKPDAAGCKRFLAEAFFRNIGEVYEFVELLKSAGAKEIKEHHVLGEARREEFAFA